MKLFNELKRVKGKKTLRPSERESVTQFTSSYGPEASYDEKQKRQRIINLLLIVLGIIFLITVGFFITEIFIAITELPTDAAQALEEITEITG